MKKNKFKRRIINTRKMEIDGETITETVLEIKTVQKPVVWSNPTVTDKKKYPLQVHISELYRANFSIENNTRVPDITKKAYNDHKEYFTKRSELDFYSSPIYLDAVDLKIIDDETVHIILHSGYKKQPNMNSGILDGGNRNEIIKDLFEKNLLTGEEYRTLDLVVITGFKQRKERAELSFSHNNSVNNTKSTKEDTLGSYDPIKESLIGESFSSNVAYKQNEKGYPVLNILRAVIPLNVISYNSSSSKIIHPNENSLVEEFSRNSKVYRELSPLIPEMIKLYELISYESAQLHALEFRFTVNDVMAGAMFAQARFKYPLTRPLTGGSLLRNEYTYFVASSYRHLIKKDKAGKYHWQLDFSKILDYVKSSLPSIIERIRKRPKDYRNFGMFARVRDKQNKKGNIITVNNWETFYKYNVKLFKAWRAEQESLLYQESFSSNTFEDTEIQEIPNKTSVISESIQ